MSGVALRHISQGFFPWEKGGTLFRCEICGNEDEKFIGYFEGKPYCRKCVSFVGETVSYKEKTFGKIGNVHLNYELSEEQKKISDKVLSNFRKGVDTLIYAVCGAGKTELVYQTIEFALKERKRVGFAIPRRDVVIELAKRLESAFPTYVVTSVFGGNTSLLEGDIICLTTHQLFHYKEYFDLLIVDEIDAFPYSNNDVLENILLRSVRGRKVLMSATPSEKIIEEFHRDGKEVLELLHRYHGDKIPVPIFKKCFGLFKYEFLFKKSLQFIKNKKPFLIFVPTISECEKLHKILKIVAKGGYFVHSKCEKRKEIIDDFRNRKYKFLVTTAVLERGVTLKDLQVIVFNADSKIYTKSSLIQIAGRVGRVKGATKGEVIFIATKTNSKISGAIADIERANNTLQSVL